jgi:thiazole biosynthesis enzyme
MLNDISISRAIVESYNKDLLDNLEVDVAVVGGGPSGLTAAYYLAKRGRKVAVFEKKLALGGGMPGGGMMMNKIVVQDDAKRIVDEFGVRSYEHATGYHVSESLEAIAAISLGAIQAGAKAFNLISAEDLMVKEDRVNGLVISWSAVVSGNLHVDPLALAARSVIDATGHAAELCRLLETKTGAHLATDSGKVIGERSMDADTAEGQIIQNTRAVYPGLYVCGMAANAVFGAPRMGPIFGGMLLSGERAAEIIHKDLG